METNDLTPKYNRFELRDMADKMLKEGAQPAEVAQFLSSQGLDISSVHAMIGSLTQGNGYFAATENNINSGEDAAPRANLNPHTGSSSGANRDILVGGLWLLGGSVVTIVSLTNGHGGIIAWGAIVFGGFQFIRGLMNAHNN